MLNRILRYITVHHLPQAPSRLLVALSGGADSVALLLIMKQLGYDVIAVHCNFHLRGEESNRDEHFVTTLCEQQNLPLLVQHFGTSAVAHDKGISIEMAARQLRYDWFEKVRQSTKACAIAVAHHSDDNAETLLLNLVRGTGIKGLKAMLPQNGHIIRPLLCTRRHELEEFLENQNQSFVTDSTNLETVYKRNKIRHEVLPLLRQLNPDIDAGLAQTAERLAEAEVLYNYAICDIQKRVVEHLSDGLRINLSNLQKQPVPATILHETLTPYGFSPAEIAQMAEKLNLQTGKLFEADGYTAVIHRGYLEVRKHPARISAQNVEEDTVTKLPNGKQMSIHRHSREEITEIPKCADTIAIDAACIHGRLVCRSCAEGDRFQPFGMKGTKLVSDYLTDRHRSVIDKQAAYCLCDEKGIIWLCEERVAQRVAITASTKEILVIHLQPL